MTEEERMTEEEIENKLQALTKHQVNLAGLINAKIVSIKSDRNCSCCKKELRKASRVVSASYLFDKKNNISYSDAMRLRLHTNSGKFKFLPVRHWICLDCVAKQVDSLPKNSLTKTMSDVAFFKYNANTQLDILEHAYLYGEITAREYQDIEDIIIDNLAFEEAVRNEF